MTGGSSSKCLMRIDEGLQKFKDNNRSRRVYRVLACSVGDRGESLISLRFVDLYLEKTWARQCCS